VSSEGEWGRFAGSFEDDVRYLLAMPMVWSELCRWMEGAPEAADVDNLKGLLANEENIRAIISSTGWGVRLPAAFPAVPAVVTPGGLSAPSRS
jgi:hypothetical protein